MIKTCLEGHKALKLGKTSHFIFVALLGLFATDLRSGEPMFGPGKLEWMINIHALKMIEAQGTETKKLANAYFNNPKTYVMAKASQLSEVPQLSIPTITFPSYASLKKAFASGDVDPRFRAVIYDSENWSFTPQEEKLNPGKYYSLFAKLVHEHHLQFLATPATNLAKVIEPSASGEKYDVFLRLGIAGAAAKEADLYEIQAQQAEMNEGLFFHFVSAAAAQARATNSKVQVLAGLSTNPNGQRVTGEQLYQAVVRSVGIVDGYWLNVPGQSPYCPRCGKAQPEIAVELLRRMAGKTFFKNGKSFDTSQPKI